MRELSHEKRKLSKRWVIHRLPTNISPFPSVIQFQSTLPRRERQWELCIFRTVYYFNPRSREGSDTPYTKDAKTADISIHAPAKGATKIHLKFAPCSNISIHAPAKGATLTLSMDRRMGVFQSTLPRRERRWLHQRWIWKCISIHAPAKGAT